MMHYFAMSDATLSALSHSDERHHADALVADELVLLLECDRPSASSSRHRLADIDEVVIGRGSARHVERSARRLVLRVPDAGVSTVPAALPRDGTPFRITHDTSAKRSADNGRYFRLTS